MGEPSLGGAVPGHSTPPITVLIATRDRPESLARALRSVLASRHRDFGFDVVVVDNAPTGDATATMLAEEFADEPRIRYVRERRPGLARAHNAGLRVIDATFVAITDDDVIVEPVWLEHIAAAFATSPRVVCVTGRIVAAELVTPAQHWVERHLGFSKGHQRRTFDLGPNRPDDPLFPFTAGSLGSGANMSFRRSFLGEIGGFDPALGAGSRAKGGDDLAAFYEVMARGHQLVYEPAAVVRHHHHRTYEQLDRQVRGYGVGLGAFLTKVVLERPGSAAAMLARSAPAIRHLRSMRDPSLGKAPAGAADVDFDDRFDRLHRIERISTLAGPWSYVRSRWAVRNQPERTLS